jgi:hypothetical protein
MFEDLEQVYAAALEAMHRGESAAMATVIEAHGSTPRGASAPLSAWKSGRRRRARLPSASWPRSSPCSGGARDVGMQKLGPDLLGRSG